YRRFSLHLEGGGVANFFEGMDGTRFARQRCQWIQGDSLVAPIEGTNDEAIRPVQRRRGAQIVPRSQLDRATTNSAGRGAGFASKIQEEAGTAKDN
ncbi:hypothetical protein AaE_015810, partial [Aphanomyces astaci]